MGDVDAVKESLIEFFEEMLANKKKFKKKLYKEAIEDARKKHAGMINMMVGCFEECAQEDRPQLVEELADVIPEYACGKMQSVKKLSRESYAMDYNLNMAAFVVPVLNYNRNEHCVAVTKRMVELWNQRKVNSLKLSHSTYEEIAGGFERKLCYITTAVCRSQGKPDDCYELRAFRDFRDGYLMRSGDGRRLVEEYYDIAPGIVMLINMEKHPDKTYEGIYEKHLMPCLRFIEEGRRNDCRNRYISMVRELEEKYLES